MSDFNDFDDDSGQDDSRDETPEETTERLRAEVAAGELHLRAELAEALMKSARNAASEEEFDLALTLIDEALEIAEALIEDGQFEFHYSIGRCMFFKSAIVRMAKGEEAGLVAFNDTIRYMVEHFDPNDSEGQNELAVALMNKADLLIQPLGAYSAAVGAQEQAARIWRKLDEDGGEYRFQLASALLACAESKARTGDLVSALLDAHSAESMAGEKVEQGEEEFRSIFVQGRMLLIRLFEQTGDPGRAFELIRETIRFVEDIVEGGDEAARVILPGLYLQLGMLYEKFGDPAAGLIEFDRCRDLYRQLLDEELPEKFRGAYGLRNGLANVTMCRANMLVDLQRYNEADEAFEEAVDVYRQAEAYRPEDDDDDETFIPYSIGVVRLNQANMLVMQGKLDEAVVLKEQALEALQRRLDAGHGEILPNLISAYRKMIGIRRMQDDPDVMFSWIDQLIRLLETTVDDGHVEFRGDLAAAFHLRASCREERGEDDLAEPDFLKALALLRTLADDDDDAPEIHLAKLQWGELLEHIAILYTRLKTVDDALDLFQKAIDDLHVLLNTEGNRQILFDVLLGYSQQVGFVIALLQNKPDDYPENDVRRWIQAALAATEAGLDLSRRYLIELDDDESPTSMFFVVKIAFFRQARGILRLQLKDRGQARGEFAASVDYWQRLIDRMDRLRSVREGETFFPEEEQDQESESPSEQAIRHASPSAAGRGFRERYLYYIGELRQTLKFWAETCLAEDRSEEAWRLFQREIGISRGLVDKKIRGADRYLILSLMTCCKEMDDHRDLESLEPLYEEARQLILARFQSKDTVADDFFMLKHVHVSYALYLVKHERIDQAMEVIHCYAGLLQEYPDVPEPELWVELCRVLEIHNLWYEEPGKVNAVRRFQRGLLARHPRADTEEVIRQYDETLLKAIEETPENDMQTYTATDLAPEETTDSDPS